MHKLELDERIYPLNIIRNAINDYSNIAKIVIEDYYNDKLTLNFDKFDMDFELIKNEFCNYLIQLIATKGE